jgi:type II secretory pathway pseudopilin PulG
LELILVMTIIAIVSAVVIPTFAGFMVGRTTNNTATQILQLAHYARTQSASEGRVYRLNFDPTGTTFWLTVQDTGVFSPLPNDFGQQYKIPEGARLDVQINPQPTTGVLPAAQDQQETPTQNFAPISQAFNQPNTLVQRIHQGSQQYIEFQPGGRTDPAQIRLTDRLGNVIMLTCDAPTEQLRILSPQEVGR